MEPENQKNQSGGPVGGQQWQGVILAAGFGTRMKELTRRKPKPLVKLAGIPLIFYQIYFLWRLGIRRIWVNSFYKSRQLRELVHRLNRRNRLGMEFRLAREKFLLGTAGGLTNMDRLAREENPGHGLEPFVLINCDVLFEPPGQNQAVNSIAPRGFGQAGHLVLTQGRLGETSLSRGPGDLVRFGEGGQDMYTGLSFWRNLLTDIRRVEKEEGLPLELRPVWEKMAPAGKLTGGTWPAKIWSVGNRQEYRGLVDRLRSGDPALSRLITEVRAITRKLS